VPSADRLRRLEPRSDMRRVGATRDRRDRTRDRRHLPLPRLRGAHAGRRGALCHLSPTPRRLTVGCPGGHAGGVPPGVSRGAAVGFRVAADTLARAGYRSLPPGERTEDGDERSVVRGTWRQWAHHSVLPSRPSPEWLSRSHIAIGPQLSRCVLAAATSATAFVTPAQSSPRGRRDPSPGRQARPRTHPRGLSRAAPRVRPRW